MKIPRKHRVLLVDPQPVVRDALTMLLNGQHDLVVCGHADDRARALALIEKCRPALAIVDLNLRESDGLELIKDIRARYPRLPVLVFTQLDEADYGEHALRAGARAYVSKYEETSMVLVALRRLLNGEVHVGERLSAILASKIVGQMRAARDASTSNLSDRELQVFELIGRGWTTEQIGRKLKLSPPTIETYRMRIKEKRHLKDSRELLQAAIRWAAQSRTGVPPVHRR